MNEYDGPERRQDRLNLERRLSKMEATQEGISVHLNGVHSAFNGMRRDLNSWQQAIATKVTTNETDIGWLKTKFLMEALGLAGCYLSLGYMLYRMIRGA
jgi:hypothetical protein